MQRGDYIRIAYKAFTDSLFPKTCPVCKEIVTPRGNVICRGCIEKFSLVREPVCEKCGKPVLTKTQRLCYDCRYYPKSFAKGRALLVYDETARDCMAGIKFLNRREDIDVFAGMMAVKLGNEILSWKPDYLVPVPVHRDRMIKRGYNQADEFAKALGARLQIPVGSDMLKRVKSTKAQKELSARERLENLKMAFEAGDIPPDAHRVVIVDDIYTTGSTMEACTRVLLDIGVEKVMMACICIGSDI